jgi:hypothetical protein
MKKLIFIGVLILILTILTALISPHIIAEEPVQPEPTQTPEAMIRLEPAGTLAITPLLDAGIMPAVILPDTKIIYNPSDEALFEKRFPGESYEKNVNALAKMAWGEGRGTSTVNQIATIECALNRVEQGMRGNTPYECVSAKGQFTGYNKRNPVTVEHKELAKKVLGCWLREQDGGTNEWRVLPGKWMFFHGNSGLNHFRKYFERNHKGQQRYTPKKSEFWD